jgi:hypothetical protein
MGECIDNLGEWNVRLADAEQNNRPAWRAQLLSWTPVQRKD